MLPYTEDSDTITFLPIRDNKTLNEDQFTLLPQPERRKLFINTQKN